MRVSTGGAAAALSPVTNNPPTVPIAALAIDAAEAQRLAHEAMVHANVVGSGLGPKSTPAWSLATLPWLHLLDREGIHIGWAATSAPASSSPFRYCW